MTEPNPGVGSSSKGASAAHRLVLGTAQLTDTYGVTAPATDSAPKDRAHEILTAARSLGIASLDTAPVYGDAERTIGDFGWDGRIHTKVMKGVEPRRSLDASLRRLARKSVDTLYIHDPSEILGADGRTIALAAELVGNGTDRLGVSVYGTAEFDAAVTHPLIQVVQAPVNLFDRHIDEERLQQAAERGKAVFVRSVFLQGVLLADASTLPARFATLGKYIERFESLARELQRSRLELALNWALALPGVSGVLLGVQGAKELEAAAEAVSSPLSRVEIELCNALPIPPPDLCDPRRWAG